MKFDYPASVRFRCVKCGICCGDTKEKTRHILLLALEAEQISKTTSKPTSRFALKINSAEPYIYEMKKREDGKCAFLENSRCTIYAVRPLICRFYPFELKSLGDEKYQFLFTEECPAIGKGRLLSEDYFRKMFRLARARHRRVANASGGS